MAGERTILTGATLLWPSVFTGVNAMAPARPHDEWRQGDLRYGFGLHMTDVSRNEELLAFSPDPKIGKEDGLPFCYYSTRNRIVTHPAEDRGIVVLERALHDAGLMNVPANALLRGIKVDVLFDLVEFEPRFGLRTRGTEKKAFPVAVQFKAADLEERLKEIMKEFFEEGTDE